MNNYMPAISGVLLIACFLCSACARWGVPFTTPRERVPDPEEEVTASPPGQSTERRDLRPLPLPEG